MANYAHVENNEIVGVYDLLPDCWRNISNFNAFADDEEFIRSLGWRKLVKENPEAHWFGTPKYRLENDEVIEYFDVAETPSYVSPPVETFTEEQLAQIKLNRHIDAMAQLRMKRDELLTATDFTQVADVIQLNGEQLTALYVQYRQQLRELPAIYENDLDFIDASTVVYPVKPEEV